MQTRWVIGIFLLLSSINLYGQSVTLLPNQTAVALANRLAGKGIAITGTGIVLNCNTQANGFFYNVNPTPNLSLAIDSGVILCTGRVLSTATDTGINARRFRLASTNWGITTTDAQMTTLAGGGAQRDICYLQFQFIPQGDSAFIDYSFASEEYPEYACSQYVDAFGIFVAPPSGAPFTNYAKVPGTTVNISTNSINDTTKQTGAANYASYCQSLGSGAPFIQFYTANNIDSHIVYDGMTKVLRARMPVSPNQTHTMKVIIGDIADGNFDSGVFLKQFSFISLPLLEIVERRGTNNILKAKKDTIKLIEGCNSGSIKITRSNTIAPLTINVNFSGTASSSDYNASSSFTMPAGMQTYTYSISAILDNFSEPVESLRAIFSAPTINFLDTVNFQILDFAKGINVFNNIKDTTICAGKSLLLTHTKSDSTYSTLWTPSTGLSCTNCLNTTYTASTANVFSTNTVYLRINTPGCATADSPINIYVQPNPSLTINPNIKYCKNDSIILAVNVSPSSGGTYNYLWSPSTFLSSTSSANPVAKPPISQTYKIVVSTSAGCKDSVTTTVSTSEIRSELDSLFTISTSCGLSNGSIRIKIKSPAPTPPYQFSIDSGLTFVSSGIFNGLSAGTYKIAIRNIAGCRLDTILTVNSGSGGPSATIIMDTTTCGLSNGKARISSKSGKAPLSIIWKQGTTTISTDTFIQNRPAGLYTLSITDSNGCVVQYAVNIPSSVAPSVAFTISNASCGLNNGSIAAIPNAGISPFTYNWSNGSTNNLINGLSGGVYYLSLTDAKSCLKIDTLTILSLPPISTSMSQTISNCGLPNGTAKVNVIGGGKAPYIYSWSTGLITPPISPNNHTITGLSAGKVYVTVQDSNGCIKKDSIIVGSTPNVTLQMVKSNTNCGLNNGAMQVTVLSGKSPYTFQWSDGGPATLNRSGLGLGNYILTVTDSNGCVGMISALIINNSNPILTATKVHPSCGLKNGRISANVINARQPIKYLWSTGDSTSSIINQWAGIYSLTITDSFGCQKTITDTLVQPAFANFIDSVIHPVCKGQTGSIYLNNITGKAPITILWSDGNTSSIRTGLVAGNYSVIIVDSNGCNKTKLFKINPTASPQIDSVEFKHAHCRDTTGFLNIKATGGKAPYNYLWNTGDTTAILTKTTGYYTLIVTDANGCKDTLSDSIKRYAPPTFSDSFKRANCGLANGRIHIYNVQGHGSFSYAWSNNEILKTSSQVGIISDTITVTVFDRFGCGTNKTFDLTGKGSLTINFQSIRSKCKDSTGKLIVTNINNGTPPYNITWSNGDKGFIADTLKYGTYGLEIIDSVGCIYRDSLKVKDSTPMTVTFDITKTRCDSNTGKIVATPKDGFSPYKYKWKRSPADTLSTITSLPIGLYDLRVTDSIGCIYDTSANIMYTHYPQITDSIVPLTCGQDNAKLFIKVDSVIHPIKIYWNGVLDSVYFKDSLSGPASITVLVRDSQKCEVSRVIYIEPDYTEMPALIGSDPPCGNNKGVLYVTSDSSYTYLWNNSTTQHEILNLGPGIYSVTVTDTINNCVYVLRDTLAYTLAPMINFTKFRPNCGQSDGKMIVDVASTYGVFNYTWRKISNPIFPNLVMDIDTVLMNPLDSGYYIFKVEDSKGCIIFDTTYLKDSVAHQLNFIPTQSYCMNGKGKIKATAIGGKPPYSYLWYNFTTADSVTNLIAGSYWLTITDARNCMVSDTIDIISTTTPILTLSPENSLCGNNKGKITSTVGFGTPPFTYAWNSSGITTKDRTNLAAGKYVLTVTDTFGCKAIDSVIITAQPQVTGSLSKLDAFCNLNNGKGFATILTGKPPYNINWNGGMPLLNISGLDSGKYVFSVIDSNNCTWKDSIYVGRIPKPILSENITHDNCTYSIGSIQTNLSGGKPPLTYVWSGRNDTVPNINNLGAGAYTLSVTDSMGCLISKVFNITDSAGPIVGLVVDNAFCGLSNGKITANVSSTKTPLSYFWNNVSGTNIKTGINGGNYIFKVIDARGCINEDTVVMDTIKALSVSFRSKNSTCNINNGYIKVLPTGGTGAKTYLWSHTTVNSDSVFGLSPGKYKVTVNDSKGCTWVDSVTLIQQGFPSISINKYPATCRAANGKLKAIVTNHAGVVIYNWSNGGTKDSISNLIPGNYILTISDGAGCNITSNTSVTNIGMDSIQLSIYNPRCNLSNGRIKAIPINPIGNQTFLWSNLSTIDSIQSIGSGTYSVTVSDSICTKTATTNLIVSTIPNILLSKQDATCAVNNGILQSTISQGTPPFNYLWSNSMTSGNIYGVDSGMYFLTVTDNYGCKDTANIYVARVSSISLSFTTQKTTCGNANGSISVFAYGGKPNYTYLWSTGATSSSIFSLLAGKYWVQVKDSLNCNRVDTIELEDKKKPMINELKIQAVCGKNNGSITINIMDGNPPFKYLWNTGDTISKLENLAVGIYKLTVTDSIGCTATKDIDIDPGTPPYLNEDSTFSIHSTCGLNNGKLQALLMRGVDPIDYDWGNGYFGKYVSNIPPGTYYLTVTDARQCVIKDTIVVTTTTNPIITLDSIQSFCEKPNGIINSTISQGTPPYSYSWSHGANTQNASGLAPGVYTLTVSDTFGCKDTASSRILQEANLVKATYDTFRLKCYQDNSGKVKFYPSGGAFPYLYTVYSTRNDSLADGLSAGKHYFTIEDNKGCKYRDSFTLTEPKNLLVVLDSVKPLSCHNRADGSISVRAEGGNDTNYTYLWSPSSQTTSKASMLGAGIHEVIARDSKGCIATLQHEFINPDEIEIKSQKTHNRCYPNAEGKIELDVNYGIPPYSYQWSNGILDRDISNLHNGIYHLTLTDAVGCVVYKVDTILSPPKLIAGYVVPRHLACREFIDGEIKILGTQGGVGNYRYSINGEPMKDNNLFQHLPAKPYTIVVEDKNGCKDTLQTKINDYPKFSIQAYPKDTTVMLGESVQLGFDVTEGDPNWINKVMWSHAEGLDCIDCQQPIATTYISKRYKVDITYLDRCTTYDTVRIRVKDDNDIYIPNAFAPVSKNEENKHFRVYANKVVKVVLRVFNRWGEKVYETDKGHLEGWDGIYKEHPAPMDVYVYYAEITYFNGRRITRKGDVTLIR